MKRKNAGESECSQGISNKNKKGGDILTHKTAYNSDLSQLLKLKGKDNTIK